MTRVFNFSGIFFLCFVFALENTELVFAQTFQHRYRTAYTSEAGTDIIKTNDNFYITGARQNPCLLKTDSVGNLMWMKEYSVSASGFFFRGILDAPVNGHFILARYQGIILLRTDSSGNIIWGKQYFLSQYTSPSCFIKSYDGNILIAAADTADILLLKVDTSGNILWDKKFTSSNPSGCGTGNLVELADHSIIVPGTMTDSMNMLGEPYIYSVILKTDAAGNLQWSKKLYPYVPPLTLDPGYYTEGYHVLHTSQNTFVLSYYFGILNTFGGASTLIALLDSTGNLISNFGALDQCGVIAVSEDPLGILNIVNMGGTTSDVAFPIYPHFIKTDLSLNVIDSLIYFPVPPTANITADNFNFFNVHQLTDKRFAFVGLTDEGNPSSNFSGITVMVTDSGGHENCTSRSRDIGFGQDTSIHSSPIPLFTSSGIQSQSILPTMSTVTPTQCTCDSLPAAYFGFTFAGNTVSFFDSSSNATWWFWQFGDNGYSYQQNPVHTYTDSVFHTVTLSVRNNCGTSYYAHTITTADSLLSIINPDANSPEYFVYPNPVVHECTIYGLRFTISEVEIYNTFGKRILYSPLERRNSDFKIRVSDFPSGIYFVTVTNDKKNRITKRFVKM